MASGIAENLDHQIGTAIHHLGLVGKIGRRIDETAQLDHPDHPVQIANRGFQLGNQRQTAATGGGLPRLDIQIRAQLANSLQCIMSQQLLPVTDGGGRVAAHEVMLNIPAIRNLIREKKEFQIHSVMMTHSKLGMMTMDQCLRDRYLDRQITLETAMAHAGNVGNLQRLISHAASEGRGGSRPGADRGGPMLDGSGPSIGV